MNLYEERDSLLLEIDERPEEASEDSFEEDDAAEDPSGEDGSAEDDSVEKGPLINHRPILWGCIGALLGGVLALRLSSLWLLALGGLMLLVGLCLLYKRIPLCLLPLLLGLTLLRGIFLPRDTLSSGTYSLRGQVISLPEKEGNVLTVTLHRLTVEGQATSGTLELTLPSYTQVSYGDWLELTAIIESTRVESGQLVSPRQRGTATVMEDAAVMVENGQGSLVYGWVLRLRRDIETHIELIFSPYAGEAKGMFLGQKEDIPYVSYRSFVDSGLVHLLTVSGLHVGILCDAALKLIRGRWRWLRALIAGSLLLLYAALTGFSPSTLRASLMVFTLFLMRAYSKQPDSLNALAVSFTLLILLEPRLLTSLGFQLSYGSVWGLFMLSEPISSLLKDKGTPVWEAVAASFSATLGTLPLLARATGQMQWVGLLLSPAVIPVAALFLIPGWIALGLHALHSPLWKPVALLPQGALSFIVKASRLGTAVPLFFPTPGWLSVILWYVGLFFLSPYFLPNRKRPPWVGYGLIGASLLCWFVGSLL